MRTIAELTYFTPHFEQMAVFYQVLLDLEPVTAADGMAVFQTGTLKLLLHQAYTPGQGDLPPENHVAIATRDVKATCELLAEKGLLIETPAADYAWGQSAYLRDPDGNQVEIHAEEVDWSQAHRFFAADCYNRSWDFFEKPDRTPQDDEQLIALAHASYYHWTQRPDCTNLTLSIGYWLLARVYALVNMPENARRYGRFSLETSQSEPPFYIGFAYESLARAESVAGNFAQASEYVAKARQQAEAVSDPEESKMLLDDLATIKL
jgi:catechol 2,3-dioxygenase-like lactoylglutathione lyase family enzyme